jgi:putative tryptophan/tyrosine transport system substrate-binding protein
MGNVDNPFAALEMGEVQAAAGKVGLEVVTLEIRRAQDIVPAFETLKGRSELYLCIDAVANTNRIPINILAVGARLPTMHGSRDYVEAGGLMSFGDANFPDQFRRSADYVDKILRGAKHRCVGIGNFTVDTWAFAKALF